MHRFVNSVEYLANNVNISNNTFSVVHHNFALLVQQADPNKFHGITVNAKVEAGVSLTDDKVWKFSYVKRNKLSTEPRL